MAIFVPLNQVIKATQHLIMDGEAVQCVFYHYSLNVYPTMAELDAVAHLHSYWFNLYGRLALGTHISWDRVVVIDMNQRYGRWSINTEHRGVTGAFSPLKLPNSAAALIHWETGDAHRGSRGRTHVPGMTFRHTDDGQTLNTAGNSILMANYSHFITQAWGANYPIVISRRVDNHERPIPLIRRVTTLSIDHILGVMRRRLPA